MRFFKGRVSSKQVMSIIRIGISYNLFFEICENTTSYENNTDDFIMGFEEIRFTCFLLQDSFFSNSTKTRSVNRSKLKTQELVTNNPTYIHKTN